MKINISILLSVLCFYSCNCSTERKLLYNAEDSLIPSKSFVSKYDNSTSFCDDEIHTKKRLRSENMQINEQFFSYDFIYNKGFIYAVNASQSKGTNISVYDTLGVFRCSFMNIGRSNNEVLSGRDFIYESGQYSFLDGSQNKILIYDENNLDNYIKNSGNSFVMQSEIIVPNKVIKMQGYQGGFSKAIPFYNGFVCITQLIDKPVSVVDTLGNILYSFGEFVSTIDKKIVHPIETNQCKTVFNKDKNILAIFYINTDLVEFYDINKRELIKRVHGPHGFYIDYKDNTFKNGNQTIQSAQPNIRSSKTAYVKAVSRGEKIWALYSGGPMFDENYPTSLIYVFDWNGNVVAKYELEHNVACFDVDTKNNSIIALQCDRDGGEMSFRRYWL